MDPFINCAETKYDKMKIDGFDIINLKPGCRSSLDRHDFISEIEIEDNIVMKQYNLYLHLAILIKVQEYENEILLLIKEEQQESRGPIDIVDI